MWRTLSRRALLNTRRSAASNLHSHSQVIHLRTTTSTEKTPRLFIYSPRFNFYQTPRFYSGNPSDDYEDSPISVPKTDTSDLDFDVVGNEGVGVVENDHKDMENLLSLLQSDDADESSLESSLKGMGGLVLDEDLLLKVLETSSVSTRNLFVFFRWGLKKLEFTVSTRVLDVLVEAICREKGARYMDDLWELVKKVGGKEQGVLSAECLNRLIARFSEAVTGEETALGVIGYFAESAFEVFTKFEEFGCHQNADSYYFTIEALCKSSMYEIACLVCEKMLDTNMLPLNVDKVGKIISSLCEGGRTGDAHLVYLYAKDKKIFPPLSSVDSLVISLSETDVESDEKVEKESLALALEMLDDYPAEDRKDASNPFFSVITKLCYVGDVDRAGKLLHEMIDSGPSPGNATFNCVINGLTKRGDVDEALKIMKLMEDTGLEPDVFTYGVVISGYAGSGLMEEACKIFDVAKEKHGKLQRVTYHSLICGFCKIEQYDKAMSLLEEMKRQGMEPDQNNYSELIESLCLKAVDWKTAEKLREDMKSNGVILDSIMSALIDAVKELKVGEVNSELSATA